GVAVAWFAGGDFALAAARLRLGAGDADPYGMLSGSLARGRAGENPTAELAAHAARLKSEAWPFPLIALFLGRGTPRPAVATAKRRREHVDAHFHIAQWHLLRGERRKAKKHFRVVVARCPSALPEYAIGRPELRRRGAWPAWRAGPAGPPVRLRHAQESAQSSSVLPLYYCLYARHAKAELIAGLTECDAAIRLDPTSAAAYLDRGLVWHQ